MKALMGEHAKAILEDSEGSKKMRSFLMSHADEVQIELSDGKRYTVMRGSAKAKQRAQKRAQSKQA